MGWKLSSQRVSCSFNSVSQRSPLLCGRGESWCPGRGAGPKRSVPADLRLERRAWRKRLMRVLTSRRAQTLLKAVEGDQGRRGSPHVTLYWGAVLGPVGCARVRSSVPGFESPDASSTRVPSVTTKSVSRRCQSPCGRQDCRWPSFPATATRDA